MSNERKAMVFMTYIGSLLSGIAALRGDFDVMSIGLLISTVAIASNGIIKAIDRKI